MTIARRSSGRQKPAYRPADTDFRAHSRGMQCAAQGTKRLGERLRRPLPPCHSDDTRDLGVVERLQQHVITSEIEHLRQEVVVSMPRRYRQERAGLNGGRRRVHLLPSAVRQVSLGDDKRRSLVSNALSRFSHARRAGNLPVRMMQNALYRMFVVGRRADQQDGNYFLTCRFCLYIFKASTAVRCSYSRKPLMQHADIGELDSPRLRQQLASHG